MMVSVDIREKDRPCRFWTLTGRYSRRRVIRRRPRALGNLFIIKHKRSALTKRHRYCVVGWFYKLNHERIKNIGRSVGTVKSSNFASARNSPSITVFNVFRMTGKPGSAGINRQVVGDEGALQERKTANPPGSSLAGEIARRCLKRRQGYRRGPGEVLDHRDVSSCFSPLLALSH